MPYQTSTTIPKNWENTTLGEVVFSANTGLDAIKRAPIVQENTGIKCFRIQDASQSKSYANWGFTKVSSQNFQKFKLRKGDILIARTGNSIGSNYLVKKNLDAVFNNGLIRLRVNDKTTFDFLYKIISSKIFNSYIQSIAYGTSTQPNMQINDLLRFNFLLPPIAEQQAIAKVLSSLQDKIDLLNEENKTLETIAKVLFREWFVDFNFPGKDGKMIESELGRIPVGWGVGKLVEKDISEFVKTNIKEFDGTKDYVETSNVNLSNFVGNFEKITFGERPSRANMQPIENSIWFARMAESRKHLLFQGCDEQNIATKILSTGFAGIKSVKEYLYFYWCFILTDNFYNLKNQFAEGAVQIAISNEGIKRIALVLPPKEIAKKFTETVEPCFKKISNNNQQITLLSSLRDLLLPHLMSGKTRVLN